MNELSGKREATGKPWLQFFDNSSIYLGVYSLAPGATDGQAPHKEDEIYYVVSGKAKFRAGDEETAVES